MLSYLIPLLWTAAVAAAFPGPPGEEGPPVRTREPGHEPAAVLRVFRQYVDPRNMVILILGDPEAFDLPPEVLGEVRIWQVEGAGKLTAARRGGPRSHP